MFHQDAMKMKGVKFVTALSLNLVKVTGENYFFNKIFTTFEQQECPKTASFLVRIGVKFGIRMIFLTDNCTLEGLSWESSIISTRTLLHFLKTKYQCKKIKMINKIKTPNIKDGTK